MAQFVNKLRGCMRTVNLTMLLVLNLFFIVTLNLTVVTVLVVSEADHGFFIQDGSVSIGGALVILYASCILMAVSLVVAIRLVLIKPIKNIIQAMNQLAAGDFTVRLQPAAHGYEPTEIREFKAAFNKAAEELSGTELLRKDFVNNFSHESSRRPSSASAALPTCCWTRMSPQRSSMSICKSSAMRASGWHSFPAVCCS
ncbi:MAG: HAMP domain-containing protein [Gemmiger sp.]|nr:HAMP domain-containing protein [Gemmiger sp.]